MSAASPAHELIRRIYAAASRGDFDAMLAPFDDAVEWITPTRTIRGRNAVSGWLSGWHTSYSPQHEVEELIDAGEEVIALVTITYRGRTANRPAHIWRIREGRVVRLEVVPVRERALADLKSRPSRPPVP